MYIFTFPQPLPQKRSDSLNPSLFTPLGASLHCECGSDSLPALAEGAGLMMSQTAGSKVDKGSGGLIPLTMVDVSAHISISFQTSHQIEL